MHRAAKLIPMRVQRGGRVDRWVLGAVLTVSLVAGAAACGGGNTGPELSAAGERGRQIALSNGCSGCHGPDGQGGVGPTWQGLAGSNVELADGSTMLADQDYLIRSISDPAADLLADYAVQMPRNNLDDGQVADIVAYINDLAAVTPSK